MPGGFGFSAFPQKPSPDPRQVGQALAQQRMQPQRPTAMPADAAPPPGHDGLVASLRALREQGAHHTGGAGQSGTGSAPPGQPDYPVGDDEAHSAMNAAVGAALTRMGNGLMAPPDATAARSARRLADVTRLGISPFEAELLSRSGGL